MNNQKLSPDIQEKIRAAKAKNPDLSAKDIAKQFKVGQTAVLKYLKATPEKEQSVEEQSSLIYYKDKVKTLEGMVKTLMKDRGKYQSLVEDLKSAVVAADPLPMVSLKANKADASTPVAAVVKLSDWQIGEVISADETEGFGVFNFAIAEERVHRLAVKLLDWVAMHRKAGYNIPELHIFSEADLVSGNIHYELEVTNEFPAPVATERAGTLLADFVSRLAPHFDHIKIWEVNADNHGRLTRKNQWKQGAKNNWSYLAHSVANFKLGKHANVEPIMSEGPKLLAKVMGKGYLLCHGHHLISQLGTPYYSMGRDKAREAVKRMYSVDKFDYISMGHFHVPAIIDGNILVNGNLPGTTEFDHAVGRNSPPSQVSFMSHPKWGLFNWCAWRL